MIFSGGAYPRMPLTRDYRALELLVRELDTQSIQAQGSAVGAAIDTAVSLLEGSTSGAGRAIFLLSDGEVHEVEPTLRAAARAADAGVVLYALGIGKNPAPVPLPDGTFLVDPSTGRQVTSRPSSAVLTDLARVTGGAYAESVPSAEDVESLYRDEIRGKLQAAETMRRDRQMYETAYQWPLTAGLLLLLGASWLGEGRRMLAVALLGLTIGAPARASSLAEADALYRAQRFEEAAEALGELATARPTDRELLNRLALARYRAGDFEGAVVAWERRERAGAPSADSRFQLGNARWLAGHLDEAVETYQELLEQWPDHRGAAANLELLLAELDQRERMRSVERPEGAPEESQAQPPPNQGEPSPEQQGPPPAGSPAEPSGEASAEADTPDGQPQTSESAQGSEERNPGEVGDNDGTRAERDGSEVPSLSDVELRGEESGTPDESAQQPMPAAPTDGITAAQAARLLESIEEGRPRVMLPGTEGDRPW